jgi:hypothetical protein
MWASREARPLLPIFPDPPHALIQEHRPKALNQQIKTNAVRLHAAGSPLRRFLTFAMAIAKVQKKPIEKNDEPRIRIMQIRYHRRQQRPPKAHHKKHATGSTITADIHQRQD